MSPQKGAISKRKYLKVKMDGTNTSKEPPKTQNFETTQNEFTTWKHFYKSKSSVPKALPSTAAFSTLLPYIWMTGTGIHSTINKIYLDSKNIDIHKYIDN